MHNPIPRKINVSDLVCDTTRKFRHFVLMISETFHHFKLETFSSPYKNHNLQLPKQDYVNRIILNHSAIN